LKSTSASASRVGDLLLEVAQLKERVRVLEERERASKTVKLWAA
jgi:hypothetical protein